MTDRRDPPWDDQGSEPDTEQLLGEWFEGEAPAREPTVLVPNVIARTALTRRRSRWFVRDWWRDLFRLHQRSSLSPALAAGGTAVVAILLLVGLALPGGFLGDAEDSVTIVPPGDAIVVSADDEDVTSTISEAIEQAEEGETVFIMPGEYSENLVIDKDIELVGGGSPDAVVLRPASSEEPIILVDGADPTISNFTITGPGNSVHIVAASPTITEMVFREVGDQWWTYTGAGWDGFDEAAPSIFIELFSSPTIHGNRFDGGGEIEVRGGSEAQITDNELINGASIFLNDAGDDTVVAGNTITDSGLYSIESTSCSEPLHRVQHHHPDRPRHRHPGALPHRRHPRQPDHRRQRGHPAARAGRAGDHRQRHRHQRRRAGGPRGRRAHAQRQRALWPERDHGRDARRDAPEPLG